MTRPMNWRQGAGVTALMLLLATAEIWALNTPMLRELNIDILGERSARDISILLDLTVLVPLALLAMSLAWRQPAWLYSRIAPLFSSPRSFVRPLVWTIFLPLAYLLIRNLPIPDRVGLFVLGAVELGFLVLLGVKAVRLSKQVRELRLTGYSLVTALMQALPRGFNSLQLRFALRLIITEFALLTYSLTGWILLKPKRGTLFSNHRRDDDTVFIAVAIVICFEAIPVHFLVHEYSVWAAWILTALSTYSLMWVLGEMAARRCRPSLLTRDWLRVSHGLRGEVVIRLTDVIEVVPAAESKPEAQVGDDAQLLFRLRKLTTVYGWFGMEKQATEIGVAVDEPERLLEELRELTGRPLHP